MSFVLFLREALTGQFTPLESVSVKAEERYSDLRELVCGNSHAIERFGLPIVALLNYRIEVSVGPNPEKFGPFRWTEGREGVLGWLPQRAGRSLGRPTEPQVAPGCTCFGRIAQLVRAQL